MIRDYHDFELHLSAVDNRLMAYLVTRPSVVSLKELLDLSAVAEFSRTNALAPASIGPYGKKLYDALFRSELAEKFRAYLAGRKPDQGVRVSVDVPPGVLPCPVVWEAVCAELLPDPRFLALDPKTPVVRLPPSPKEIYQRPLSKPLRILVFFASPLLMEAIDPPGVRRAIETALRQALDAKLVQVEFLGFDDRKQASFDALQQRVAGEQPPFDVVHIVGHGILEAGEEGRLALVDPSTGREHQVEASSLAGVFTGRATMLVVLQSCHGGDVDPAAPGHSGLAEKLVAFGVPAVVALRQKVDQDVASHFMNRLYEAWVGGRAPIEDALTQARLSVRAKYPKAPDLWAWPVLYRHAEANLAVADRVAPVTSPARVLDAALPDHMRVKRPGKLLVLIRSPDRPGLRELIQAEPRDFDVTAKDVRTTFKFDASFPENRETRAALPMKVSVRVESEDFDVATPQVTLEIRPDGESVMYGFTLTPRGEGKTFVEVKVLDPNVPGEPLAYLRLGVEVRSGETFETRTSVLDAGQRTPTPKVLGLDLGTSRSEARDVTSGSDSLLDLFESSTRVYSYAGKDSHDPLKSLRQLAAELTVIPPDHVTLVPEVRPGGPAEFRRRFRDAMRDAAAGHVRGRANDELNWQFKRLEAGAGDAMPPDEWRLWVRRVYKLLRQLRRHVGPIQLSASLAQASTRHGLPPSYCWECGLSLASFSSRGSEKKLRVAADFTLLVCPHCEAEWPRGWWDSDPGKPRLHPVLKKLSSSLGTIEAVCGRLVTDWKERPGVDPAQAAAEEFMIRFVREQYEAAGDCIRLVEDIQKGKDPAFSLRELKHRLDKIIKP